MAGIERKNTDKSVPIFRRIDREFIPLAESYIKDFINNNPNYNVEIWSPHPDDITKENAGAVNFIFYKTPINNDETIHLNQKIEFSGIDRVGFKTNISLPENLAKLSEKDLITANILSLEIEKIGLDEFLEKSKYGENNTIFYYKGNNLANVSLQNRLYRKDIEPFAILFKYFSKKVYESINPRDHEDDPEYIKRIKIFKKHEVPEEDWMDLDDLIYSTNSKIEGLTSTKLEASKNIPSVKSIIDLYFLVEEDINSLESVLDWVLSKMEYMPGEYKMWAAIKLAKININECGFSFLEENDEEYPASYLKSEE